MITENLGFATLRYPGLTAAAAGCSPQRLAAHRSISGLPSVKKLTPRSPNDLPHPPPYPLPSNLSALRIVPLLIYTIDCLENIISVTALTSCNWVITFHDSSTSTIACTAPLTIPGSPTAIPLRFAPGSCCCFHLDLMPDPSHPGCVTRAARSLHPLSDQPRRP